MTNSSILPCKQNKGKGYENVESIHLVHNYPSLRLLQGIPNNLAKTNWLAEVICHFCLKRNSKLGNESRKADGIGIVVVL